jgi:hypothetical protein
MRGYCESIKNFCGACLLPSVHGSTKNEIKPLLPKVGLEIIDSIGPGEGKRGTVYIHASGIRVKNSK